MSLSADTEMRRTESSVLLSQEPIAEAASFYCSSNIPLETLTATTQRKQRWWQSNIHVK